MKDTIIDGEVNSGAVPHKSDVCKIPIRSFLHYRFTHHCKIYSQDFTVKCKHKVYSEDFRSSHFTIKFTV